MYRTEVYSGFAWPSAFKHGAVRVWVCLQDAEFMENKRAKRAARNGGGGGGSGARGTPHGSRMQLDEVDAGMRSLALSRDPTQGNLLNTALEPGDEGGGAGPGPGSGAVQSGPTMMSREARAMMMSGLGAEGLQMWKVG